MNPSEGEIEPFKVYIRIRPLNERELLQINEKNAILKKMNQKERCKNLFAIEDDLLFLIDPASQEFVERKEKSYAFDHIFQETSKNQDIFLNIIANMINNVLNGYNSTALAYGVTGAGKTHTMFGDAENYAHGELDFTQELGVCIYAIDYLFNQISSSQSKLFQVKISYLEIYNEQVIDLLIPRSPPLMIVEDHIKGVIVPDLTELTVSTARDLVMALLQGNTRRTMAATNQNVFSSRSHAILQIQVEQKPKLRDTIEEVVTSKFMIVDLAGSERGGLEKGIRREEGSNINKSLLSLGTCINLLSDKTKKGTFIPYRDSKLTRLLKDSLGGNIQTVMIACVGPSPFSYDETVSTLNYATRARKIVKKVTRNIKEVEVHISQYKDIIDSLKSEIESLKELVKLQQRKLDEKEEMILIPQGGELELNEQRKVQPSSEIESKSFCMNPMGNYSTIALIKKKRKKQEPLAKTIPGKTLQSIDLEIYKNYLENEDQNNLEVLEKQMENLQNDKNLLEEYIEKSKIQDSSLNEKYQLVKQYYERYLELINDKLIDNIEQNMILKYNLKEICELNQTNYSHLELLSSQIPNFERYQSEIIINGSQLIYDEEIAKLREEKINIELAIQENETIKEKITQSLTQNLKLKKMLKKILLHLISNTKNAVSNLEENP